MTVLVVPLPASTDYIAGAVLLRMRSRSMCMMLNTSDNRDGQ